MGSLVKAEQVHHTINDKMSAYLYDIENTLTAVEQSYFVTIQRNLNSNRVSVCKGCVSGVYENMDVFVKRYMDVLERPRKYNPYRLIREFMLNRYDNFNKSQQCPYQACRKNNPEHG